MKTALTQKQIGQRITKLRKARGFSQADLAKMVHISRPSITQIELGNRNISILEFQQLSLALSFSLDNFISSDFQIHQSLDEEQVKEVSLQKERIAIPALSIEKFKNVLLYILEKCAGKPNIGETVLNKLLYFADFNYYEVYEEHLSGALYKKLPYGPVPQNLNTIMKQMIEQGVLSRMKTEYHGYPQTRYIPLIKADLTQLQASETEIIDKVIEQMGDWSASSISNYSHKDIPWLATKDGEEINYELAFYREAPFSARNYGDENEQ